MANSHLSVHWMAALDGMDASEPDSSQSDHYYNSYSPEDNAVNIPNVNEESNSLPLGYLRVCRTETNSILSEILNGLDPEKFPKGSKYLSFQLTPLEAFLLRQLISIVAPAMNIFAADSFVGSFIILFLTLRISILTASISIHLLFLGLASTTVAFSNHY